MSALTIRDLNKHFSGSAKHGFSLSQINLEVPKGELLVLLGPSGSGKTTLLRCIAGLSPPTAGSVRLGETVVSDVETGIHVPTYKRNLGMVFQGFALWPHMTVRQNIAFPLKARGQSHRISERVDQMLRLVRCEDYADRIPSTLSGGQQQRIALARALSAEPSLILFDEPLSNLDALLRVELRAQLRQIHRETRFTGVYVTHDQIEAMTLATNVAVMNRGVIEQLGTPQEIYNAPKTEFVSEFMGMQNLIRFRDIRGFESSDVGPVLGTGPLTEKYRGAVNIRFRPETTGLRAAADISSTNSQPVLEVAGGSVTDRAFNGDHYEYVVRAGTSQIVARTHNAGGAFDLGQSVIVSVPLSEVRVFQVTEQGQ